MTTTDHGKGKRRVEGRTTRKNCNGLLARIDELRIFITFIGERPHAEQPVFTMQGNLCFCGDVVGDKCRQANSQVHNATRQHLFGRTLRYLIATKRHFRLPRDVRAPFYTQTDLRALLLLLPAERKPLEDEHRQDQDRPVEPIRQPRQQ